MTLGRGRATASMIAEPRTAVAFELGRRTRHDLVAAALAGEAVLVLQTAGKHARETPDLLVQRLGARRIRPRVAPR